MLIAPLILRWAATRPRELRSSYHHRAHRPASAPSDFVAQPFGGLMHLLIVCAEASGVESRVESD